MDLYFKMDVTLEEIVAHKTMWIWGHICANLKNNAIYIFYLKICWPQRMTGPMNSAGIRPEPRAFDELRRPLAPDARHRIRSILEKIMLGLCLIYWWKIYAYRPWKIKSMFKKTNFYIKIIQDLYRCYIRIIIKLHILVYFPKEHFSPPTHRPSQARISLQTAQPAAHNWGQSVWCWLCWEYSRVSVSDVCWRCPSKIKMFFTFN